MIVHLGLMTGLHINQIHECSLVTLINEYITIRYVMSILFVKPLITVAVSKGFTGHII